MRFLFNKKKKDFFILHNRQARDRFQISKDRPKMQLEEPVRRLFFGFTRWWSSNHERSIVFVDSNIDSKVEKSEALENKKKLLL